MKKYAIIKPDATIIFVTEDSIDIIKNGPTSAKESIYFMNNVYSYFLQLHIEGAEDNPNGQKFLEENAEERKKIDEAIQNTEDLLCKLIDEETRNQLKKEAKQAGSVKFLKAISGQKWTD